MPFQTIHYVNAMQQNILMLNCTKSPCVPESFLHIGLVTAELWIGYEFTWCRVVNCLNI